MRRYRRKCKNCGEWINSPMVGQITCSVKCAIEHAQNQRRATKKKELRDRVLGNNKRHQTKLAQAAFNKFIRLRDERLPCISCGRFHQGQYHAGHYRTTAAAPQHRFNEDNCAKQCSACNNHKSGNIVEYRINLIKRIGVERVEALENDNDHKKWIIEELINIKQKYQALCRELEKENAV